MNYVERLKVWSNNIVEKKVQRRFNQSVGL